jgi:hypothetical protein
MYYTSCSCTEDTSFNGLYPSGATLYGISADSATDVWIVGAAGSSNFVMHKVGSGWVQFTMPNTSGQLRGVAVLAGDAWAGGYIGTYNLTPTPLTLKFS